MRKEEEEKKKGKGGIGKKEKLEKIIKKKVPKRNEACAFLQAGEEGGF